MDVHSPEQRSFNMSRIKAKNTKPEMILRKRLWKNGYRYRLHGKNIPGSPDLIFPKYRSVIFVHGCFWHRHGCKYTTTPSTRKEFWEAKFEENVKRDQRNIRDLENSGWHVLVVWECEVKNDIHSGLIERVEKFLKKAPL